MPDFVEIKNGAKLNLDFVKTIVTRRNDRDIWQSTAFDGEGCSYELTYMFGESDDPKPTMVIPALIPLTLLEINYFSDNDAFYFDRYPILAWRVSKYSDALSWPMPIAVGCHEGDEWAATQFIEIPWLADRPKYQQACFEGHLFESLDKCKAYVKDRVLNEEKTKRGERT